MREALTTIAPICNSLTACGPHGGYGTCGALAKGVPAMGTSKFTGTDSGWGSSAASSASMVQRSSAFSPRPRISSAAQR
jgi:hypothetical protein